MSEADIEKHISNLKKYINEDDIYRSYKEKTETYFSDFDMFCIKHCKDIENILAEREKDKERIKELEEERDNAKGCFIVTKENSIPKQKIQDKIEELKALIKKDNLNKNCEAREFCSDDCNECGLNGIDAIQVLQELLENKEGE